MAYRAYREPRPDIGLPISVHPYRQLGRVAGLAQSQRVQRAPRHAGRVLRARRGPELAAAQDRRRRRRPRAWEKRVLSARGFKRVGRHSEHAI